MTKEETTFSSRIIKETGAGRCVREIGGPSTNEPTCSKDKHHDTNTLIALPCLNLDLQNVEKIKGCLHLKWIFQIVYDLLSDSKFYGLLAFTGLRQEFDVHVNV